MYRINVTDGSWLGRDDHEYETRSEAVAAVGAFYGWDDPVTAEWPDGGTWSVYESQEDADEDEDDGAHGPSVSQVPARRPRPCP